MVRGSQLKHEDVSVTVKYLVNVSGCVFVLDDNQQDVFRVFVVQKVDRILLHVAQFQKIFLQHNVHKTSYKSLSVTGFTVSSWRSSAFIFTAGVKPSLYSGTDDARRFTLTSS